MTFLLIQDAGLAISFTKQYDYHSFFLINALSYFLIDLKISRKCNVWFYQIFTCKNPHTLTFLTINRSPTSEDTSLFWNTHFWFSPKDILCFFLNRKRTKNTLIGNSHMRYHIVKTKPHCLLEYILLSCFFFMF